MTDYITIVGIGLMLLCIGLFGLLSMQKKTKVDPIDEKLDRLEVVAINFRMRYDALVEENKTLKKNLKDLGVDVVDDTDNKSEGE